MSRVKGFFSAGLSSASYGLIPLFTLPLMKSGMYFDSILIYRFTIAFAFLGLLMLIWRDSFKVSAREFITLFFVSLFYLGAAYFLFWSYKYLASGAATTLHFMYPVFVAAAMSFLFKEKLSLSVVFALVLAIIGVAVLSLGETGRGASLTGVLIALLSAVFYGLYIIGINKTIVSKMPSSKVTFYMLLFGAAVLSFSSLFGGGAQTPKGVMDGVNLFLLALIPTIIANAALVYALKNVGSVITSVMGALKPMTAVFVGVLVFKEPFTANLFSGIVLIISAVTLVILSGRMDRHIKSILNKTLGHLGLKFD